jgi:transposase
MPRKKGGANKTYSGEFKQLVIEDMRNNHLSQRETARKYEIGLSVVQNWERIYFEEGSKGLYIERRGRSSNKDGRPIKLRPEIENDLIAENQRLRMENEYLKKLNALIHQKEKLSK